MTFSCTPRRCLLAGLLLLIGAAGPCGAAMSAGKVDPPSGPGAPSPGRPSRRTFTLFPDTNPFTAKIADPVHSTSAILPMSVLDEEMEGASDERVSVQAGGVFPLAALHPEEDLRRGWFVSLEASFYGQFDRKESLDIIGWDGVYGMHVTHGFGKGWALKAAFYHRSSHLGDEFIEGTGRRRIDYTREELQGGISRRFCKRWRTYGEVGYGTELDETIGMEIWRLQTGLEYEAPETLWQGRAGWYAAGDVTSWEENDWDPDVAIEGGLLFLSARGRHRYRLKLAYYNGRILISDFFQQDEEYFLGGIALDF